MNRKYFIKTALIILLVVNPFLRMVYAQTEQQKLEATILFSDSLFWAAYNNCDTQKFHEFFTNDVEFYHDKGGITSGLENLTNSIEKNLCSNENFRLRREAVAGTVKVFPLQESNTIYGAIISGDHVFYIAEKAKKERLDGLAKFTHVWILKDNDWKMSRILSYDHGPAPYMNKRKEIKLSNNILNQFPGTYEGQRTGKIIVQIENGSLALLIKNEKLIIHPEAENLFFIKERDIRFEFIRTEKNNGSKMLIREGEEIVEEAVFVK